MLKLIRVTQEILGTYGVLLVDGEAFCVTLERPWVNNNPNVSCIPEGRYICNWTKSQRAGNDNGWLIGVDNVQGRSLIRIHVGNKVEDSKGCILLGTHFLRNSIGLSRAAHRKFLQRMRGRKDIPLSIHNYY